MPLYNYPQPSDSKMKVIGSIINPDLNELDVDRQNMQKLFPDASMRSQVEWKLEDDLRSELLKTAQSYESAPNEYATQLEFASILQSAGYPLDTAMRLSKSGAVQQELGLQYKELGSFDAMKNNFLTTWYSTKVGKNFSKYMLTGDERYLRLAEEYDAKSLSYKSAKEGYGWLGDMAVAGASTLGSSLKATFGGIVITGAATLVGFLAGGPAGATLGYTGGKTLSKAWTMYEAGMEQAGSDFYQIYKMTDSNGNRVDLSGEEMKALFMLDVLMQGSVEVVGLDWAPGYRQMMDLIAPSVMREAITKTFGEMLRKYGADVLKGIIGESLEEFAQEWVGSTIENAVLLSSNTKDGTDFGYKGWRDVAQSAGEAFGEAAKGMVLQSVVTSALGLGLNTARTATASKNQTFSFDPNKKQGVLNSKYIAGNEKMRADVKAEEEKAKESGQKKEASDKKVPQIKVVQTEKGAVPATEEDAENLKELYRRNGGKGDFDVIIEGVEEDTLQAEDRSSVLNMVGAIANDYQEDGSVLGYTDGALVVKDEEAVEEIKDKLSRLGMQRTSEGDTMVFVRDGRSTKVDIITREQADARKTEYRPVSTWQFQNMAFKSATRVSAQEALTQAEQQDALKRMVEITTGMTKEQVNEAFENDIDSISMNLPNGITWENLTSSAMFMPVMSQITGRTTEELLDGSMINFDVTGKTQYVDRATNRNMTYNDQTGKVELRDADGNVTAEYDPKDSAHVATAGADVRTTSVNGKKNFTIRINKEARAEDIMHELMHVTRALASKEKLAGFINAYGSEDLWTDDIKDNGDGTWTFNGKTYTNRSEAYNLARVNEERFVSDFMTYLREGTAPNAEMKSFFQSLKDFFRKFVDRFRDSLSEDTVRAFDRLLSGEVEVQPGQTIEEAVEASDATLTDEVPQWEANDYSDEEEESYLNPEGEMLYSIDENYDPEKTGHGYKLFEQDIRTGELYPLFIGKNEPTKTGVWNIAENIPTKGFSNRPGWHIGSTYPLAVWLLGREGRYNSQRGKNFRRIWCEVSYPMDVDYQSELDERGIKDIKDHTPENGYYRFREANGEWIISGALRIDKVMTDADVKAVLEEQGVDYNTMARDQIRKHFKVELPEDYSLYSLSPDRDYRQVTFDDFHMATEGTWEYVERNSEAEKKISKKPYDFRSLSGSTYWYDRENNTVYRMSDHWGRVASCVWELDTDEYAPGRSMLGKINLNDLSRIIQHNKYYGDYFVGRENGSSYIYPIDENGHIKQSDTLYSLQDNRQWQVMDANTQRRIDADYDFTRNQYFGTDKWMKAPNGQPTKLTERQWVQVRTPAFKQWFGDWENDPENSSRVVDENGEPKIVYHGTNMAGFETFQSGDFGVFFTDDVDVARSYVYENRENPNPDRSFVRFDMTSDAEDERLLSGSIYAVFLNMRDPVTYDAKGNPWYDIMGKGVEGVSPDMNDNEESVAAYAAEYSYDENPDNDGTIVQNVRDYGSGDDATVVKPSNVYVIPWGSENQIKSVDNVGTFSRDNDSILFSIAPPVESTEFKNWFNGSKVVDAQGNPLVVYHGSPVTGIDEFNADTRINGGEGLIYATDSTSVADRFSQEFTQGSSFMRNRPTGRTGQVYQVYMDIKSPLDFRNLSEAEKDLIARSNDVISARTDSRKDLDRAYEAGNDQYVKFLARDIVANLGQYGYDGIIARMGEGNALEFGAVNADQVKRVATGDTLYKYDTDEEAERLYSIRPDTYSEVADYISTMPEAERDRIFRNLEQFKGSPWYYQTLSAALVRKDMESLINGEGIPSDSFLYKASRSKDGTYAVIEALKKGPEGVFGYVQSHSLVANSEKALFAINGSTLDCNPTPECSQFCYVTNGQMAYPTSIIKAEMVALAIRLDPVRAARMAAIQYKYQAGYDTKLVMRMFDRGDFSAEYVPFIKELNKQGVGVQIFTKRPDFLYEIDRQRNVVMMSVDHSNVDMIEKYPDLPIAVVYQGKEDVPMIESLEKRFKEHKGVILPVKIGREYVSEEDIMALPQWARVKFTCNIDRGLKTIDNWNCRKCDLNGINGCFFERGVKDREMVGRSIEDMSIGEIYDIIGSLKDRNDATKELIGRGINLWDPRFGRVLDELLALRNRELEGSLGGATAQTGTEPSPDTGGEPEVASGRGLVEEHNLAVEDFASEYPDSDVAELDGVKYIKDSNDTYTDDELRSIKDSVSEILHSIQPEFDFSGQLEFDFNGDQRSQAQAAGGEAGLSGGGYGSASADLRGLRQGVAKYFDWDKGWNGQEPSSFIDDQWDRLGYISFIGAKPNNGADLAKLFSVYKNPKLEYFHLILTKGNEIVYHLAMSAGVPDMSFAIPDGGSFRIKGLMKSVGADGYYLMHNHPGRANMQASGKDKSLTDWYASTIPGFKGHVILGNTSYGFFDEKQRYTVNELEGMHKIKGEFPLNKKDEDLGTFILNYTYNMKSPISIFYADSNNNFYDVENLYKLPTRKHINEKMKSEFYTRAWGVTTDWELYNEMMGLVSTAKPMYNLIDFYYIDPSVPDKTQNRSMKNSFRFRSVFHSDVWGPIQANITRRGERGSTKWEKEDASDTLYSLSPERKAEVLEQRKREIQRAVEAGIFVSTEYLNEFRGEDWVQSELELRDWMNANPDVVAMAKSSSSVEEFKKKYLGKPVQDNDDIPFDESGLFDDDEIPFTEPEDEETEQTDAPSDTWFEKIYQYAHALSSADRDRQFAAEWTATEDKTLELANTLRSYMDAFFNAKPNSRKGGYWYTRTVYGAFKGVSQKVRMLRDGKSRKSYQRERSSSEEIREAQELIRQNPRPYRNAYMTAMMAESRAAQVRAGEQTGIGEDADWMRLEMIDDDIAQEMEKLESESTAAKKPKTDYSTKYEDLKKKLRDAERDLQKANENSRTTIGNLRSQLDLANAKVDALQKQLREDEADLQNAEKEYSDLIERLGGKIEDLQEDNAELRAEKSRARKLEKQLEERRNRVKELRSDLTAANRETRRLQNALDASRRYIEAKKASEYRNKRLRQIRNLATFNPDTQDASFEESFDWVLGLFIRDEGDMEIRKDLDSRIAALKARIEQSRYSGENVDAQKQELLELRKQKRQSRMLEAPAQLALYLPQGYEVRADNRPSMWSAEELDILLRAVQLMRMDAKAMLADKKAARDSFLNSVAYKYFRQASGREGQLNEYGEMSSRALIEDILSQPEKTFGKGAEKLLSYHLYKAKIQRLARIVDGDSEGVIYDWFVRRSYRNQTKELSEVNRRLALGDNVWKELGLKHGELAKEGFQGKKENGTEYSLTRGQMIGVYIYSKSELGYEKLTSISGNGITEDDVENISNALTDKERAWAEFLLSEMDGNWQRLADTYYLVWNRNLGRRESYFPLASAVALHSEDTDFLCGENTGSKDGKAYVDKGFTKEVNPNAIYPLNLDATATWNKQVRRQEHFVAYGEWARDTQRLLDGGRGMLGAEIKQIYGEPYYRNIQRQADHVISNYITTGTGFDTVFGKYFSARNAAALTASFSTMFKQLGSIGAIFETGSDFSTVFAGENYFRNFLLANEELNSEFGEVGNVREFIYQNAPDIRNRKIDHEVMAYMNRVYGGAVSNAIQKVTGKVMEYTTNACDRLVVERLWLAKYYTEFETLREQGQSTRKAHEEAVFKASQLISETQPTSMRMDQSGMQIEAQKNSLLRMIAVFTNQAMNIENMVMFDIPLAFRQKNWKKVAQVAAAVAVNVGFVALVSGRFVKKGDEDDDKYAMRLVREILATIASTVDPVFGGNLASGILYGSQGQDYLAEFNDIGEAVRKMLTPSDRKTAWERISAAMEAIASEAAGAAGIPAGNVLKRPIQAVTEKNPGYLINSTWGQIVESYR